MKKLISIMLLCAVTTLAFSQKTSDTTVSADVKYLTEKVERGINNIASGLHVQPQMVYSTLERQVEVEIYYNTVAIWVISIILGASVLGFIIFFLMDIKANFDTYGGWVTCAVIGGASFITASILIPCCACNIYQMQVNPEYWILQEILTAI